MGRFERETVRAARVAAVGDDPNRQTSRLEPCFELGVAERHQALHVGGVHK